MKKTSVVLDTNLFVAAFWNSRSASAWIIEACRAGHLALVYTAAIKRELDRILQQIRAPADYQHRIQQLLEISQIVEPKPAPVQAEDRDDQKFLECALGADADYIVTSDEHLLKLEDVGRTAIVTPTVFRRRIEGEFE